MIGYEISKANYLQENEIDDMKQAPSVISMIISDCRKRSDKCNKSITTIGNETSLTNEKSCFKIDKILYNLYGDLASAMRSSSNNENDTEFDRKQMQNAALIDCIKTFINECNDKLTESILMVLNQPNLNKTINNTYSQHFDSQHFDSQQNDFHENASQLLPDFDRTNEFDLNESIESMSFIENEYQDSIFTNSTILNEPISSILTEQTSQNFYSHIQYNQQCSPFMPSTSSNHLNEYIQFDMHHSNFDHNNSKNKYSNTFKSIPLDIKLRKSNLKDNINLNIRTISVEQPKSVKMKRIEIDAEARDSHTISQHFKQSERFRFTDGEAESIQSNCNENVSNKFSLKNEITDQQSIDSITLPPPPEFK